MIFPDIYKHQYLQQDYIIIDLSRPWDPARATNREIKPILKSFRMSMKSRNTSLTTNQGVAPR